MATASKFFLEPISHLSVVYNLRNLCCIDVDGEQKIKHQLEYFLRPPLKCELYFSEL